MTIKETLIDNVNIDQALMADRLRYSLDILKRDIEERGQLRPLLVVAHASGAASYELLDGVKRWVVMRQLGYKTVKINTVEMSRPKIMEFQLLNPHGFIPMQPSDFKRSFFRLRKDWTLLELAQKTGVSVRYILEALISND